MYSLPCWKTMQKTHNTFNLSPLNLPILSSSWSFYIYTEYLIFPHWKLDSLIWYKPNNGHYSLLLDALAFVELAVYTTLYPTSLGKANLDASAHAIEHVLNAPPFSMWLLGKCLAIVLNLKIICYLKVKDISFTTIV